MEAGRRSPSTGRRADRHAGRRGATCWRPSPPAGPRTSAPARCSTACAPSTGCPRSRPPTRCAAPSCTRCSRTSSTSRRPTAPPSAPRRWCRTPGSSCSTPSRRWRRCSPATGPRSSAWLASCRESLRAYFALEDPRRLEPAERELYVEALLDSRLLLRGFVDRIDIAPDGAIRVVDYKTGRSPASASRARRCSRCASTRSSSGARAGVVPALLRPGLPRRRPDGQLRARRAGPAGHRAARRGDLAGHRAGPDEPGVAAQPGVGVCVGAASRPTARLSATNHRPCRSWSRSRQGQEGRARRARSLGRRPTRLSRNCRRSPLGTGTWCGTTRTWQPAAAAEAAPVGESSMATVSSGAQPEQLGGA